MRPLGLFLYVVTTFDTVSNELRQLLVMSLRPWSLAASWTEIPLNFVVKRNMQQFSLASRC